VLRDLIALLEFYPAAARTAGEFRVPVDGGIWRGVVMTRADKQPVLTVRTFIGG
jgi:hypothetical protein